MVLADTALITAFAAQSTHFIPSPNQWKHVTFNFTTTSTDTRTRFKFEFVASNYSNNFYLDNFVVDGVLGISENEALNLIVYPNPSNGTITISGLDKAESEIRMYDLQGKLVYEHVQISSEEALQLETGLKAGCYLAEVSQNGSKFLTRVIVE